jgi:hypothetical protein
MVSDGTKYVLEYTYHQREGRKSASDRRAQLHAIRQKAKQAVTQGEKERMSREDEEMAELLQGMVLQQERKEKELAQKFAERERKLWSVSLECPYRS